MTWRGELKVLKGSIVEVVRVEFILYEKMMKK
jgi:hypothetical protein